MPRLTYLLTYGGNWISLKLKVDVRLLGTYHCNEKAHEANVDCEVTFLYA